MRSLALHNLKGGVGKTTTAVNLAHLAANDGLRTLVWDLDPQGAASLYLGVGPGVPGGAEMILGAKDLGLAVKRTRFERLHILPADMSLRLMEIELDQVKKPKKRITRVLDELSRHYDLIVLDAPPGLGLLAESVFRAADVVLVPLIPSPLGLYVYKRMVEHLVREGYDMRAVAAFFSMVDRRRSVHRDTIEENAGKGSYLATTIPYAAEVERMGVHRAPLATFAKRSPCAQAYVDLWNETRVRLGFVLREAAREPAREVAARDVAREVVHESVVEAAIRDVRPSAAAGIP